MSFLWIGYSVVAFLCCNSQLEVVLAGKNKLGPNDLHMWRAAGYGTGGEHWIEKADPKRLYAEIGTPNGETWFVTTELKQSRISYLDISANPLECDGKSSSCNLTIYGATNTTSNLPVPLTRQYITRDFEPITTMTFPLNNRTLVTSAIITKSYQRLAIFTDKTKNSITRWDIYSMELYYYFCERKTTGINLKQTNSSTTNLTVRGVCPRNAVSNDGIKTNITVKCSVKGKWIVSKDQECVCDKGFGLDNSKTCSPCQKDHHKANISNNQCLKCPNGKTNNTMRTECQCKEDYYIGKDKNGSCYELPSAVKSLKTITAETSVKITWSKPSGGGYNETLTYSVECYHCIQSNQSTWECDTVATDAMFSPNMANLTTTHVNISNLVTNETYKFKIVTRNSLKNVPIGEWNYLYSNETKITPPVSTSSKTTPTNPSKSTDTSSSAVPEAKQNDSIMFIGIGIGAGILIALLIVLVVITRSRRAKSNKDGSDNLGYESVALPTIGQRMYVDPSNYDDPEAAVKDFANEISPKSLNLERVLGGGEFGDVYKGTLKTEDGGVLDVAAKTLKHDSDARSRKDFFMEASAMGQFDDPNVIHLEGVITKSVPHMIVTEYMSNGSLDHFLKQNDENLTDLQLVGMARGVSSGMRYLAAMHFVHRDLAARNVLVTDTLLCKVADFGLSRELETDDSSRGEYCTSGGKIPVRWTAPESIKYRKFSTASDVWSYGILLWEIMAFAERPYWDWDNFKVLERVDEGYRLPAPKNCPKAVHDLMLLCWETDRSRRPQFADIVRMLDDWIRSPETIRYEKIQSMQRPGSGVVNDPTILIKEWLNDIKMSSYVPHFTQAGFRQLSDLAGLLDSDLQAIGVTLIGHRNKMLRTIRSLPITDESKKSPWNRATSIKI